MARGRKRRSPPAADCGNRRTSRNQSACSVPLVRASGRAEPCRLGFLWCDRDNVTYPTTDRLDTSRLATLRRQAMTIAGEGAGLLYGRQVQHLLDEALDAHSHSAVRAHAVLERCQVVFEIVGG